MAQCAEELSTKRKTQPTNLESHRYQLRAWRLKNDLIMVAILETDSESGMSRWGFSHRDSMRTTKKVLNLGNQQQSDLREDTKICKLLYGLIFHWV